MSEPIQTDAIEFNMRRAAVEGYYDPMVTIGLYADGFTAFLAMHKDDVEGDRCPTIPAAINSLNQKLKEREKDNV